MTVSNQRPAVWKNETGRVKTGPCGSDGCRRFLRRALSEADWVELIAILLDNAIEAASPGDVLYARAIEEAGSLRFSVLNPTRP